LSDLKKEYYDTMIITKDTGIHPYDKIIINQTSNFPVELNWTNTKYKFLSLIVIISKDETYDIKLNSKMENYYILGNIIDNHFIKYYLEKYYKFKLMIDDTYMLQLIDQNVKVNILNIDSEIINKYSSVSREVATLMAQNVRKILGADIGVATTGVAGPAAVGDNKVGTVFVALSFLEHNMCLQLNLMGDRQSIREETCNKLFEFILEKLV